MVALAGPAGGSSECTYQRPHDAQVLHAEQLCAEFLKTILEIGITWVFLSTFLQAFNQLVVLIRHLGGYAAQKSPFALALLLLLSPIMISRVCVN